MCGVLALSLGPVALGGGPLSEYGEPVWVWVWGLAGAWPLTRWSMALSVWLACSSAELSWDTPSLVSLLP